jgi:hypothetical protein
LFPNKADASNTDLGNRGTCSLRYNPSVNGFSPEFRATTEELYPEERENLPWYDTANGWATEANKPADVTLFHEMVHCLDSTQGIFDASPMPRGLIDVLKISEMRAVGLDEFLDEAYLAGTAPLTRLS